MLWPFKRRESWKDAFNRGMAAGQAGNISDAVKHFEEAVRLDPHEPYPHYELGYSLSLLGDLDRALAEFRRTNDLAEGFFLVQTEIYLCEALQSGLLDSEALAAIRKIQRLTDCGQAQSPEAARLSREVTKRAPNCALGFYYLGKALMSDDSPASEEALRQCLALNPDDTTAIDALAHLGEHRRRAGNADEARQIWGDVVERYKTNPHVKPVEVFFLGTHSA
jgi:tetratricopeptide (TPR) repeat protein